jgi:hypothetical protein
VSPWQLIVLFLVVSSLLGFTLYLLRRISLLPARLVIGAIAGFLTDFAIRVLATILLPWEESSSPSYFEWIYHDLFGLGPLVARLITPEYLPDPNLIPGPGSLTYALIRDLLPIAFWTCLFGAVYFRYVRRSQPSDLTRRCS